jgi:glycerol-1-phosphate dehydrogenase [NAD(P)+]
MSGFDRSKLMLFPRHVLMGHGVISRVGELAQDIESRDRALVVADERTFAMAGKDVVESLKAAGFKPDHVLIRGATTASVRTVTDLVRKNQSGILFGVGGGSVIDVTKLSAFETKTHYVSVPTSAAHDGIASARASIKEDQGNVSKAAKPPDAIVADTSLIARAPHRMLASGCGDVLSNLTALLDWQMAARLKGEEYSSFAAALSRTSADFVLEHADDIKPNNEDSAWVVVKSLITSGVAMSVAGDSRPASGAEHMLSHMLDRMAPGAAMHGEQCGVGTILMMYLHDGDWRQIRDALRKVGAPTTVKQLGIARDVFVDALSKAHTIRPDRYTILGETGLTHEAAEQVLKATGVG